MRENRAKRRSPAEVLAAARAAREKLKAATAEARLGRVKSDRSKIFSRSVLPSVPDYYRDRWFECKICGTRELWTAQQQKIWYEEQGGEIEAIAIHCRECRRKEKARKAEARRVHQEGLAR